MTNERAEGVLVACPLFQAEGGGSSPTSALQLRLEFWYELQGLRVAAGKRTPMTEEDCDTFYPHYQRGLMEGTMIRQREGERRWTNDRPIQG